MVSQEATVTETEALAIAWIRSHCELTPGASVGRQELYADYVTFCSKAGKRSVLSGQHFSTCIKNQFPQSTLKVKLFENLCGSASLVSRASLLLNDRGELR